MKRFFRLVSCLTAVCLCVCLLAGCGKETSVDTTNVVVKSNGKLVQNIIEEVDDSTLDAEDLKTYVEASVEVYKEEYGSEGVAAAKCEVQDGTLTIEMDYESYEDYQNYNQVVCFVGTLEEAKTAGYNFDGSFLDNSGKAAAAATILAHGSGWKVLILKEAVTVQTPGKILYTSDNVAVTSGKMAVIKDDDSTNSIGGMTTVIADLAYIIYK